MCKMFNRSILPKAVAAGVLAAFFLVLNAPDADACGMLNRRIAIAKATGSTGPHDKMGITVSKIMGGSTTAPPPSSFGGSTMGRPPTVFGSSPAMSATGLLTSPTMPVTGAYGRAFEDARNPAANPYDIFNRSAFDPPDKDEGRAEAYEALKQMLPPDVLESLTLPDDYVVPRYGVDTRRIFRPEDLEGEGMALPGFSDVVGGVEHSAKIIKAFIDDPNAEKILDTIGGKAEGLGNLITNFNRAANLTKAGVAMDENAFAEAINELVRDEVKGVAGKAGAAGGKLAGGVAGAKFALVGAIPGAVAGGVAGKYGAEYVAGHAYDATTAEFVKEQARQYFRENVKEGQTVIEHLAEKTKEMKERPPAVFPVPAPYTPYPLHH